MRDRIDLDQIAVVKFGHRDHSARRTLLPEELGIGLVEGRPIGDADDVGRRAHDAAILNAGGLEDGAEIGQGSANLFSEGRVGLMGAIGPYRQLARDVDYTVALHGLSVMAARTRRR